MLLGPVFVADLVTSARRNRYFWLRAAYASLVLLFLGLVYVPEWTAGEPTIQSAASQASGFFSAFAYVQISAVLLLGPAFTAGAIATERERRTIEYLFATDLSNGEIVYGKFAAALARMFVLLLVAIPILAIARLLGGIAYDRMLAVFAVTASTAVAVVALALTISVWSARAREAVMRTYLCLFGLIVLPLIGMAIVQVLLSTGGNWLGWFGHVVWLLSKLLELLTTANPYVALTVILGEDFRAAAVVSSPWQWVGTLVAEQAVVVALCAILAPWAVRRVHLRAAGGAAGRSGPAKFLPALPQAFGRFRRRRRNVSETRPMLWKELVTERSQSRLGWIGRIVVFVALLLIVGTMLVSFGAMMWNEVAYPGSSRDTEAFQAIAAALSTLATCGAFLLVATRGATSITSEKERETWNALLATPLEASEIVWAKFWGSLYAVRWVVPLLGFFWLLTALAAPQFLIGLPLIVATTAILGCCFTAIGLAFSLYCANSTRALGMTLAVCIALGGGYYLCCGCLIAPLAMTGGSWGGVEQELLTVAMLSPWPPFLVFAPYFLGQFVDVESVAPDLAALVIAYVVGNSGYFAVSALLLTATVNGFDRAVGRCDRRDFLPRDWGISQTPPPSSQGSPHGKGDRPDVPQAN